MALTVPTHIVPIVRFVIDEIKAILPTCTIRVYGSLIEGTCIPGTSKVCLDVSLVPQGESSIYVLCKINNYLQRRAILDTHYKIRNSCVIHQKTTHRPYILTLWCQSLQINVTYENVRGMLCSLHIRRIFLHDPKLQSVYLYIKHELKARTNLVGPNFGQISTYALFLFVKCVYTHMQITNDGESLRTFVPNLLQKMVMAIKTFGTDFTLSDPLSKCGHNVAKSLSLYPQKCTELSAAMQQIQLRSDKIFFQHV